MNRYKKIVTSTLTMTILCNNFVPVLAAENSSKKEEVIYINTGTSGQVSSVDVVNIFGNGNIVDYGDYSNVKMMNSTKEITTEGYKITFNNDKDRTYYQGIKE